MRKTILVLICIASLILISLLPVAGLAQSTDQIPVIDGANLFGNKLDQVTTAAIKLNSQGADVRIRTIMTYSPSGNLDQYEAQLEKQNPSWLGTDGNIKNNLILLLISLQERQTGLYYGDYWVDIIGDRWLKIQTDIMIPLFSQGDYAGGAVRGLAEIQRLIESSLKTQTAVSSQATAQPQTTAPSGSGFGWWWVILLVIVFLVAGVVIYLSSKNSRVRRQAVGQKALLAKQAAASGIHELTEKVQMLEIKVNVISEKVTPEEALPLRDGLQKAGSLVDLSSQRYSELAHSAGDPENPRLTESQLTVIETEYSKIVENLRQARDTEKGVEDRINTVQQEIEDFPKKVSGVNAAIETALAKQEELKQAGFKSAYPAELVAKGRLTLGQAQELFSKKHISEGLKYVDLAEDQIQQAIQAAEDMPRKKQEAEAAIPALATRIEHVKETANRSRDVFERLYQAYAPANWESIRGNGTEAENRINWALEALEDARLASGMEQQEWHKSLELVKKGNDWLTEAETLIKSIIELEEKLAAERLAAPNEVDAAQADVTRAWDYIRLYDDDIRESLEDDLQAAEKKNETAREELKQEKPDYFKAGKLAREANEAADKILLQARSEHEAAERLRAKAVTVRRDAAARVAIASKYIEVHHPSVKGEARNYLVNAIDSLRQAEAALDTESQISLAAKAESAAERAYALAQSDVASTTINIPNFRTPTIFIPPTIPPPRGVPSWGSSRPSSSGSGGGAFRPGGGIIRPGGGGSTGWSAGGGGSGGGGGRRGGGSTGW
jgi:uncharacterized membrane protein YgcG